MERYRPASHPERIVCKPSAVALWYREQVEPCPALDPTIPPLQSSVLYKCELPHPVEAVQSTAQPSVQIYPLPESSDLLSGEYKGTSDSLVKLRTPYDDYERYLASLLKRLKHPTAVEVDTPDGPPSGFNLPELCTYPTMFGNLSFAELVEHTRKYVASVLRNTYQVNETNIDDGLQAGYLRLWQRLQDEPELLHDKSLAWVSKGIVYTALHATRGDWQFRRRTQTDEEISSVSKGGFTSQSRESRQMDIRTDLHRAIEQVEGQIRKEETGKRQDYDLWALFGLAVLQVSASEATRLVGVREQSLQAAYNRVKERLQKALPNYAPSGKTETFQRRGRKALPEQDVSAIRKANGAVTEEVYETVREWIEHTNAGTRRQDEVALEGIRYGIPASVQSRSYGISQARMQRAYVRVSLLIGSQRDPTIRVRRPEHRVKSVFTLTEESAAAVEQLALALLKQPKSYEKIVALHAHISNLAISTTAKHFNIPTSTLRYYAQQIGTQLNTPIRSTREADEIPVNSIFS